METPKECTIRPMGIEDYDVVYRLWLDTPGMGLNPVDDSRAGIEKYLRRNPGMSFVAEDAGGIVGVILCGHDGRRGVIHHTAVRPASRRRGVGRKLAQAAFAALRAEGVTKAWLVVKQDNALGNAFWERMGFEHRMDLTFRGVTLDQTLL